jgi:uncharacterized delta-60 repeat protein
MKKKISLLTLLISICALQMNSQPIGLDQSFATNGVYYFTEGSTGEYFVDVAVQSDGKPVAVGYTNYDPDEASNYRIVVMRFNINGTPDPAFGSNGKVYIDTPQSTDDPKKIAIQADGKIVIGGNSHIPVSTFTYPGATVYRLNVNGSFDNSFGTNGRAYLEGEITTLYNLVIQPNGRIVISGYGFIDTRFSYFFARFTTNGQKDPTFGNGTGFVKHRSSTSNTEEDDGAGRGLALQPDGKILSCGYNEKSYFIAVRLNGNGSLDPNFSTGGFKRVDFGRDIFANSVAVQNDGKIVFAGDFDFNSQLYKAFIIRVLDNGNDDISFNNGSNYRYYGNSFGTANDMEIQSDGKFVMGDFVKLIRVNANSNEDTTFDGDGYYSMPLSSANMISLKLSGNKIYVVGNQYTNGDYNGFIARISNNFTTTPALEAPTPLSAALFPNPASDILQVKLPEAMDARIDAYDLSGQLLYSTQRPGSANAQVSVADWPNGMYYMSITLVETGLQRSFPFVVQH